MVLQNNKIIAFGLITTADLFGVQSAIRLVGVGVQVAAVKIARGGEKTRGHGADFLLVRHLAQCCAADTKAGNQQILTLLRPGPHFGPGRKLDYLMLIPLATNMLSISAVNPETLGAATIRPVS